MKREREVFIVDVAEAQLTEDAVSFSDFRSEDDVDCADTGCCELGSKSGIEKKSSSMSPKNVRGVIAEAVGGSSENTPALISVPAVDAKEEAVAEEDRVESRRTNEEEEEQEDEDEEDEKGDEERAVKTDEDEEDIGLDIEEGSDNVDEPAEEAEAMEARAPPMFVRRVFRDRFRARVRS